MQKKNNEYRKDKIITYLKRYTENICSNQSISDAGLDATTIAKALNLDRTNVSRDLNLLYQNGAVLKLLGRPTRYLYYRTVAGFFPEQYVPHTIPLGKSLALVLKEEAEQQIKHESDTHPTLIDTRCPSMRQISIQAEAAVDYPPYGLHTLLMGDHGIGRTIFAKKIFDYGKKIGRFSPEAKLYMLDCRNEFDSVQKLAIQIFGCGSGVVTASAPKRRGLLEQAEGSVLLFTEAQLLPMAIQEKIVDLITHNTFTRVGEPAVKRTCKAMLIAVSSRQAVACEQIPFLKRFPVQLDIPSISQRTMEERFLFLYDLFQKEATILDCEIQVSKSILYYFFCAVEELDTITLKNNVKNSCSIAYHEQAQSMGEHCLEISYRHLPPAIRACSIMSDASEELLEKFEDLSLESLHIHVHSIPPDLFKTQKWNLSTKFSSLIPDDANLFYMREYLKEYLYARAESEQAQDSQDPALAAYIVSDLQEDDILRKLTAESPLLQSIIELFSATIGQNIDRQVFELREENTSYALIPEDLKIIADKIETHLCRMAEQKSEYRASIITMYLYVIRNHLLSTQIKTIFIYRGKGVSEGLSDYINDLFHCASIPIPWSKDTTLESILVALDRIVSSFQPDVQILIFSDGFAYDMISGHIEKMYSIVSKTICGATFEYILRIMREINKYHFTLDMIGERKLQDTKKVVQSSQTSTFITQAALNLLAPSLDFLDITKALPLLESSYYDIIHQLSLPDSDNMATKYQFHCTHMIERLIRKEPLKYPHLKAFINDHSQEFQVLGKALRPLEQSFGIHVPSSEVAYLVEVFLSM